MTNVHGTRTIVVGVDGSGHAEHALDWALSQAEVTGDQVLAVTCWEYPVNLGWVPPMPVDYRPDEDARTMLDQAVEKARAEHPGVDVHRLVVEGSAAGGLIDAAKGADLLVVGTRGHGGFAGLLLGSVSEHCVAHAPCPVVVVRH